MQEIGQSAEALKAGELALSIDQKLIREYPDSPGFMSSLGGTLNTLSELDLEAKRFEEARVRLREAIEWQRKAMAVHAAHPQYRQFLANHLGNLILAARGLGRDEEAAEAQRGLDELKASDPQYAALNARLAAVSKGEAPKDPPSAWPWLSGPTIPAASPPPRSSGPTPWRKTPSSLTIGKAGIATTPPAPQPSRDVRRTPPP